MQVEVTATSVVVRLATEAEVLAIRRARRDGEFDLPGRSYFFEHGPVPPGDEPYVVAQPFVEFRHDGVSERWEGKEYHGRTIPLARDATNDLLALAGEARDDLTDILADMSIAGFAVRRWDLASAPATIVLDAALEARLAPKLS